MTAQRTRPIRIAIVGTVGLPAGYGGFETLAANLVRYAEQQRLPCEIDVYCSSRAFSHRLNSWHGARLRYIPLNANGAVSPLYDFWSMLLAVWRGADAILVLGVSGAIVLPVLRLLTRSRYIVNVDGLEWRRAKWTRLASRFLRLSEAAAVRFSHEVIADNQAIVDYIQTSYNRPSVLIPYGGDHAVGAAGSSDGPVPGQLPDDFALMLCRIEPENNVHVILDTFANNTGLSLVAVGNWQASAYGRNLKARYTGSPHLRLLDPVFEPGRLYALRRKARLYIHGHSAGGTNPSLVEMMYLAKPVIAYDCVYNRFSTEDCARYFGNAQELGNAVREANERQLAEEGQAMGEIARRRYRWKKIGEAYFNLLLVPRRRS